MGRANKMIKIISIFPEGKLAMFGIRCNILEFDEKDQLKILSKN